MKRLLLIVISILTISFNTYSDDAYLYKYPFSGNHIISNNNDIAMLEETVVWKNDYFYTSFIFTNSTSMTQHLSIGFPVYNYFNSLYSEGYPVKLYDINNEITYYRSEFDSINTISNYFKFSSFVDGNELHRYIQIETNKDYDLLFIGDIEINPFHSVTVSNVYYQQAIESASQPCYFNWDLNYYLKSGQSWNNSINSAIFYFYLPYPQFGYYLNLIYQGMREYKIIAGPDHYIIDYLSNYILLSYCFTNLEPDFNIDIQWGYIGLYEIQDITDFIIDGDFQLIEKDFYTYMDKYNKAEDFINALLNGINYDIIYLQPRFLINSLYALNGYSFQNNNWRTFFESFDWYDPFTTSPLFTDQEQEWIKQLIELETQ